jgi:cell shape-determining protein MreC
LSTLTKILIVLLTVSAIFLCGIVVTYVANAENYRQLHEKQQNDLRASEENVKNFKKQLKEKTDEADQLKNNLTTQIASLKTELTTLKNDLQNLGSEKAALLEKVNSWASITKDFSETTDKQGQLLKRTLDELDAIQAEQIKQKKSLDETTAALREKMAIIETLQTDNKRLLEEKTELQARLGQQLMLSGKEPAAAKPVTPKKDKALPTTDRTGSATQDIALNGLVTAVDMKNSMASISIGSADGVKSGMKFHVTRGDEFICDILIIDVDLEEAVGVLELVQQNPKVGDNVSSNL